MSNYTPIKYCYDCLESYLLFVDFGLSDATAGYLAGLKHVVTDTARFQKLAQEVFRGRTGI